MTVASLILEVIGVVLFYRIYGYLGILLENKDMFLRGHNFFDFLYLVFRGERPNSAILFMTLGIIVLILTPYIRVVVSAVYFARERDTKYVLITTFVLVVITLSLILH